MNRFRLGVILMLASLVSGGCAWMGGRSSGELPNLDEPTKKTVPVSEDEQTKSWIKKLRPPGINTERFGLDPRAREIEKNLGVH